MYLTKFNLSFESRRGLGLCLNAFRQQDGL